MAKQQKSQDQSQPKRQPPPAALDDETSEQNARELNQTDESGAQDSDQTPDRVEIGDPVPEADRTTRARGQGETGEDEDLPDDDGSMETTGARH